MTVTINGTTGIAGANGSAGTPAVQGEDTNTGVFFPAADTVAVATGGSERMRVDSSGNVGVGTTSVTNYSGYKHLSVGGAGKGILTLTNGSNVEKMYLQVTDDSTVKIDTSTGVAIALNTNGAEHARIDTSGNLLVGTTSAIVGNNSAFVSGNGNSTLIVKQNSSGRQPLALWNSAAGSQTYAAFYAGAGPTATGSITTNGTSTTYATSSDHRLKENVQPMQDALAVIAQLNPVTYTWKADGSDGQGFIAHELQAVVPDCVTGEKDAVDAEGNPQYQGVDTSFLVATLVKAVQELKAEVDSLKAQLEAN